MSKITVDAVEPSTGTSLTLGASGDTITIPSGATLTNSGTATGFGSPAYASNASATDDTVNVDASDNLQFNSGYGSTATAYGCRAWVKFVGTGTVTISDSANVSSVTDTALGRYFVNFTNAFPDVNFSAVVTGQNTTVSGNWPIVSVDRDQTITTSGFGVICYLASGTQGDNAQISAMVVR
jgi:hypothetical protein